jgi:hypothetical protein
MWRAAGLAWAVVCAATVAGCVGAGSGAGEGVAGERGAVAARVACVGRLVEYQAKYDWFDTWNEENGQVCHDDGRAVRAVFRLVTPEAQAGREVGVVFKYWSASLPPPPTLEDKGRDFSFDLPGRFLAGKYVNIDNIDVGSLKRVP